MVYLDNDFWKYRCEDSIRTRIVMVYLMVQPPKRGAHHRYSYKNCYGLSNDLVTVYVKFATYSYKNCYGLSLNGNLIFTGREPYSYKNCYGLFPKKTAV